MRKLLLVICLVLLTVASVAGAKPKNAVKELIGQRTVNSKIWQNSDGSMTAEISAGLRHYKDKDGKWQDIDTSFGAGAYEWCRSSALKNPVRVHVGSRRNPSNASTTSIASANDQFDTIMLETENGSLSFVPDAASASEPVVSGNTLTYTDVWPSVDLRYTVHPSGLKEDIILKQRPSTTEFRYAINHDGLSVMQKPDGSIVFTNADGVECFFIPTAFMYDSEGQSSNAISMSIESVSEAVTTLCIKPNVSWLADATYPVVVDPTISSTSTQAAYLEQVGPTPPGVWHVSSYYPNWTMHINSGMQPSGQYTKVSYIKWNLPALLPVVVDSATITLSYPTGTGEVGMRRITSAWAPVDGQTGYPPSVDPEADEIASGAWRSTWSSASDQLPKLRDLVEDWIDGDSPNYGIEIHAHNSSDLTFLDDGESILSVTYHAYDNDTTPPSVPGSVSATPTSISGVSGSWTASEDPTPGTGIWQYQYAIGTAPNADNIVNWTSTKATSFSKSGLSLPVRTDYYLSVKAADKAGNWSNIGSCAFQCSTSTSKIVYVDKDAGNDTFSGAWNAPKKTISGATSAANAGDRIWVKAASQDYNEPFYFKPGVGIYGGFTSFSASTADDWSNRNENLAEHRTVLNGTGLSNYVVSAMGSINALRIIDGFHIKNGATGIYCYGACVSITNNVIESTTNSAIRCLAYSSVGSSVLISGNTISSNTSSSSAGGIFCSSSSATITNNTIINNTCSTGIYGGIALSNSGARKLAISGNTITGNHSGATTGTAGSGILCSNADAEITNNWIQNNTAATLAGGVTCIGNTSSLKTLVANNVITSNTTTGPGGGQIIISGIPQDEVYGRSAYLLNNTVVGQTGNNANSCIYCTGATSPHIFNNIMASAAYSVYNAGTGSPSGGTNLWSAGHYLAPNVDGIPGDPGFTSDYRLSPDSLLCIDKGCDSVVQASWTDCFGEPRIEGARVDIGADEYNYVQCQTIGELFDLPLGTRCTLSGKVCTVGNDVLDGEFYIQEDDCDAGVRVKYSGAVAVPAGKRISVVGYTGNDENRNEFTLYASDVIVAGEADVPFPISRTGIEIGGNQRGSAPALGVTDPEGSYNKGLLIRTDGYVTYVDPSGQYFYVDSTGTAPADGSGHQGIRVSLDCLPGLAGMALPVVNDYCYVCGVSSSSLLTGTDGVTRTIRVVRPRGQADLTEQALLKIVSPRSGEVVRGMINVRVKAVCSSGIAALSVDGFSKYVPVEGRPDEYDIMYAPPLDAGSEVAIAANLASTSGITATDSVMVQYDPYEMSLTCSPAAIRCGTVRTVDVVVNVASASEFFPPDGTSLVLSVDKGVIYQGDTMPADAGTEVATTLSAGSACLHWMIDSSAAPNNTPGYAGILAFTRAAVGGDTVQASAVAISGDPVSAALEVTPWRPVVGTSFMVKVTIEDANGLPVADGTAVTFRYYERAADGTLILLASQSSLTHNGVSGAQFIASLLTGKYVVEASVDGTSVSVQEEVTCIKVAKINLIADPTSAPAGECSPVHVELSLSDDDGYPVPIAGILTYSTGALTPSNVQEHEYLISFDLFSPQALLETISAECLGKDAAVTVRFTMPAEISMSTDLTDLEDTFNVNVMVTDQSGSPVANGTPVSFQVNGPCNLDVTERDTYDGLSFVKLSGLQAGASAAVTASCGGGISDSIIVAREPEPELSWPRLLLECETETVAPGQTATVIATVYVGVGQAAPDGTEVTVRADRGVFPATGEAHITTVMSGGKAEISYLAPMVTGTSTLTAETPGCQEQISLSIDVVPSGGTTILSALDVYPAIIGSSGQSNEWMICGDISWDNGLRLLDGTSIIIQYRVDDSGPWIAIGCARTCGEHFSSRCTIPQIPGSVTIRLLLDGCEIAIQEVDGTDVHLVAPELISLDGTKRAGVLRLCVRDSKGQPIENAPVSFANTGGSTLYLVGDDELPWETNDKGYAYVRYALPDDRDVAFIGKAYGLQSLPVAFPAAPIE